MFMLCMDKINMIVACDMKPGLFLRHAVNTSMYARLPHSCGRRAQKQPRFHVANS